MSLMAVSAPRSSVFTFESTVHSSNVLLRLDEQRRRDMLCDVTVVVEGQSFRAHRSVLASCSEYFTQRISSLTQHGAVVSLPQEVTVTGFEPLLKFAYTSKLLFSKDDVLDVRNAASILGFRDLDEACFDFLLPKFFSSTQGSGPFPRKTCCKKKCESRLSKDTVDCDGVLLDEKEVKPVAESPFQQEVAVPCNKSFNDHSQSTLGTLTPVAEGTNYLFHQGPKYRKFQQACGKEACFPEKSVNNPVSVISNGCDLPCSPCCSSKTESEAEFPGNSSSYLVRQSQCGADDSRKSEIQVKTTAADTVKKEKDEMQEKWREKVKEMCMEEDISFPDFYKVTPVASGPSTRSCEGPPGLILHHCPLKTLSDRPAISGSVGHETLVMEDEKTKDFGALVPIHQDEKTEQGKADGEIERGQTGSMETAAMFLNNARERSTVEREVAEHLAQRLGSDYHSSQPNLHQSSDEKGSTSLEWLHLNISSTTSSGCPFFQDLDRGKCLWKGAELSECEGASQSGVSSFNSGEDGDSGTETEGDSEASAREKAKQMQLPFPVDWIIDLSRNDFQQLLKQQVFTREQLEFIHDMRRRSKNRLAAQRCRKRKLDCIYNLQCEINKLKTEREKLITERSQLSQLKLKTCHNVSALCQKVCNEANLQPEQLQVLAKYTSPDCPLSSVFPHIDTLLSQPELQQRLQASLTASSLSPHQYRASEEALSSSSKDTVTGDGQH